MLAVIGARTVFLASVGLGLQASPSPSPAPAPAPALELPETAASFGEVYEGALVTHRFAFRNRGKAPVRITELRPVSSRGRATAHPAVVPPGGEGYVEVEQPTEGRLGVASFRFALQADDGAPERKLALTGFVQSAYDPDQPVVDLGIVSPGASSSLELFSREVDRLEVSAVLDAPAFLAADTEARAGAAQEGVVLRLRLRADAPLGFHTGTLRLRTNVPQQPEAPVVWRAGVYEDMVPSEAPVDLGVVREGQPFVKVVLLATRSGGPLAVERLDSDSAQVKADLAPCPEPADSCRVLRLSGVGPAVGTPLGGAVTIVPRGARPLALPYSGVLVGAQATVKDLGLVKTTEKILNVAPPEPASPAPPIVGRPGERRTRLTWQAQQEQHTYGYLVYRSNRREGPYRRINREILPVSAGDGPHVYHYVDEPLEPGETYYYYVESIYRGGAKARLSGVIAKFIPKAPQ